MEVLRRRNRSASPSKAYRGLDWIKAFEQAWAFSCSTLILTSITVLLHSLLSGIDLPYHIARRMMRSNQKFRVAGNSGTPIHGQVIMTWLLYPSLPTSVGRRGSSVRAASAGELVFLICSVTKLSFSVVRLPRFECLLMLLS